VATQSRPALRQPGSRFYVVVAVVSALIVFAGFARTFYLNSFFARRNLTALMILHGVIFSCWIILLLMQTTLVAAKRTDIHRRLGFAGVILAVLMIVVGLTLALHAARYGFQTSGLPPPLVFLVVPFFDIVMFAILVGAAFYQRARPDVHKRLMLTATIAILPPAFARIPLHLITAHLPMSAFVLGDLVLLACVACDAAVSHRLHRAYLWGGAALILSFPLRMLLAGTTAWMSFARWITRT
jgi:hypothetical protein